METGKTLHTRTHTHTHIRESEPTNERNDVQLTGGATRWIRRVRGEHPIKSNKKCGRCFCKYFFVVALFFLFVCCSLFCFVATAKTRTHRAYQAMRNAPDRLMRSNALWLSGSLSLSLSCSVLCISLFFLLARYAHLQPSLSWLRVRFSAVFPTHFLFTRLICSALLL